MLAVRVYSRAILFGLIAGLFMFGCQKMATEYPTAVESSVENQSLEKSSSCPGVCYPPDILVTTTSDVADFGGGQQVGDLPGADGLVSLREAIDAANHTSGPQVIGFHIPKSDDGFDGSVFTIRLNNGLPDISDDGTTIDGSSQAGFTGNTNTAGPEIVISDNSSSPSEFQIVSRNNHIHCLVLNGFSYCISIRSPSHSWNKITGCFIGVDATGTRVIANEAHGISIWSPASHNRIGGTTVTERNIISGNRGNGIALNDVCNNIIQGNFIGTDVTGTKALGNGLPGVQLSPDSYDNLIGSSHQHVKNVISGGNNHAIWNEGSRNVIKGNYIGTDVTGMNKLGNNGAGIRIATPQASYNRIIKNIVSYSQWSGIVLHGSNNFIQGNIISHNNNNGINVEESSEKNAIRRNRIFSNAWLGIDLGGEDGVTPNDPGDLDSGPNNLMNYPVLTEAITTEYKLTVWGVIDTPDPERVTIEFFANPVPEPGGDPSGRESD